MEEIKAYAGISLQRDLDKINTLKLLKANSLDCLRYSKRILKINYLIKLYNL